MRKTTIRSGGWCGMRDKERTQWACLQMAKSAWMLVAAWLRHVAATLWRNKRHLPANGGRSPVHCLSVNSAPNENFYLGISTEKQCRVMAAYKAKEGKILPSLALCFPIGRHRTILPHGSRKPRALYKQRQ